MSSWRLAHVGCTPTETTVYSPGLRQQRRPRTPMRLRARARPSLASVCWWCDGLFWTRRLPFPTTILCASAYPLYQYDGHCGSTRSRPNYGYKGHRVGPFHAVERIQSFAVHLYILREVAGEKPYLPEEAHGYCRVLGPRKCETDDARRVARGAVPGVLAPPVGHNRVNTAVAAATATAAATAGDSATL